MFDLPEFVRAVFYEILAGVWMFIDGVVHVTFPLIEILTFHAFVLVPGHIGWSVIVIVSGWFIFCRWVITSTGTTPGFKCVYGVIIITPWVGMGHF